MKVLPNYNINQSDYKDYLHNLFSPIDPTSFIWRAIAPAVDQCKFCDQTARQGIFCSHCPVRRNSNEKLMTSAFNR